MAVINTINNRKDYNPADILKASAAKAVKSQTAQATTAQPEAKEIDTTEYLTDAERQRMDDIVSSPTVRIENDEKAYLMPSRKKGDILNTELSEIINSHFKSMFVDYVGCELSIVSSNARQMIQAVLVFTPKPEKLDDSDTRIHNIIEISDSGSKSKSVFGKQISQVSAHASGRYFKFNDATKKVLENYIPNSFFKDGKVNWSSHDKGMEKTPLTIERRQQLLRGNPSPSNKVETAVTMEYLVVIDLDKVVNDAITLTKDKDEKRKTILYTSVGNIVPTIQGASGRNFFVSIEEIDIEKDRELAAASGISYVTSNNYYFGSNIR